MQTDMKLQGSWFLNPCFRDQPGSHPLLETSVGRCRFCGAIQCFCSPVKCFKGSGETSSAGQGVRLREAVLAAAPTGCQLDNEDAVLRVGSGCAHTSEGRETAFPPFPPSPHCFMPYCSSEQCPRSLNSFSLNCRHCITHTSACSSIPKHLPLFIWMV